VDDQRSRDVRQDVARYGDGFHAAWSLPTVMGEQRREMLKECDILGRLGTDLVFSVRAGYGIRDDPKRDGTASLTPSGGRPRRLVGVQLPYRGRERSPVASASSCESSTSRTLRPREWTVKGF